MFRTYASGMCKHLLGFHTRSSLLLLGIASLIAGKLVEVESYVILVQDLGLYMITVVTGLFINGLIVLPLIYFIITRRNIFTMIRQICQTLLQHLALPPGNLCI